MKINKITIALNEAIFLEFCKTLNIKNIKTNEDIIIGEKMKTNEDNEEETTTIVHGKSPQAVVDYLLAHYIYIEKILILSTAKIVSNWELQSWDVIVPNTFLWANDDAIFTESTIGEDYNLNTFGLILNWICCDLNDETITKELTEGEEFIADVNSKWVFTYLKLLDAAKKKEISNVILQIWEDDYKNLIAVSDMSL